MLVKPRVTDVQAIKSLIEPFAATGQMLPKSLHALYTTLRDFWVVTDDAAAERRVIGCCALQVSWEDYGEIRTLAVNEEFHGQGYGRQMVERCLEEAPALGLKRVFTLTYVPDFFKSMGFVEVDKSQLPNKIWSECIHCPYFPDCREVALLYTFE